MTEAGAAQSPLPSDAQTTEFHLCTLDVSLLRTDGETQCRAVLDQNTIQKYKELMESGIEFPPVRVWFDGEFYWLSDGFQRVAASRLAQLHQIRAEVRKGSRSDAQWDSYSCNAAHGLPRTTADLKIAIVRALAHEKSARLSNVQIAKHLRMPEATFRRWYKELSSSCDEDKVRIANRNGTLYPMRVHAIGRANPKGSSSKAKSLKELRSSLTALRANASSEVRSILNIFNNWVFGSVSNDDCLKSLERVSARWRR